MKPKGSVWKFFDKIVDQTNKAAYKCRYCKKIYKHKHATRLRKHLKTCVSCPTTVKNLFKDEKEDLKQNALSHEHNSSWEEVDSVDSNNFGN